MRFLARHSAGGAVTFRLLADYGEGAEGWGERTGVEVVEVSEKYYRKMVESNE